MSLIAEIKRASPSRGIIAPGLSVAVQAGLYQQAGARAISVLTEERFFQGSLADLTTAAENTQIPILRKDFVIDAYQVWEAALAGASGVLLIVRVLGNRLAEMVEACRKAGLEPLVEVHSAGELDIALECDLKVIGVNCRDLDTLNIDPTQHARMRLLIPSGVSAVAESGIRTRQDVQQLEELGYDAILVGESLMDTPNPAIKVAGLLGRL
jgi:indole-3-glycerol phosphate synthase